MLILHASNRLEILADQLADLVRQPCGAPFSPEIIVVQSTGLARWLPLHLARRLGICAHVHFPLPGTFVWDLFRRMLSSVPESSPFAPEVMTWRIMALLGALEDSPQFVPLRAYCGTGEVFKRFELAGRIADVFDQYLVYRPDWIRQWERGADDHWQAELWRRLIDSDDAHRVRLHDQFLANLSAERVVQAGLPARLSLIGISTMPPLYLEIFARLAAYLEIHGFLLNPCQGDWRESHVARRTVLPEAIATPAALAGDPGNPLLASMGKLGRDFLDLVHAYQPRVVEQFVDPGTDTLLYGLQADILHGRRRGVPACSATPLRADDRSVQVHVCHSPMREVEVLHDQLLKLFETSADLQPADVIVMTPDIDAYAPCIEAVFGAGDRAPAIPFSIADRGPRAESPLVNGFFALLDLPGSRYDAHRLFTLLELAAVQRRFALEEHDLALVHRWLLETGVRWGIDQDSRAALGLPATREHTWRAGLERLLMGYALPGDTTQFFADILPYDAVEGTEAQVLGRFCTFADAAFALATTLRDSRSVPVWSTVLSALLEQFFQPDEAEEADLQAIRSALQQIDQVVTQAGFDTPIGLDVMKASLRRSLETLEWPTRFLTGGVTFCAMVPMRSIPFEVVCLIGMHYDNFPRRQRSLSFDRMAQEFRPGDRSRRDDDRYLFLEALLSARSCLYVSYVGHNIRDNSVIPPSVLVSELLDAIAHGCYPAGQPEGEVLPQIVTHHPLQAFSRRYFSGDDRLFSYAADLCEASRKAGCAAKLPERLVIDGLSEPGVEWRTIELRSLLDFFRHPTRYFIQKRLGIFLQEGPGVLESREPFTLEALPRYRLRQAVLQRHLQGEKPESMQKFVRAAGLLPHGQAGQALFEREWPGIERFAARLQQVLPMDGRCALDVDLAIGEFRLTGQLIDVTPYGLVGYRLGAIRAQDHLELWIRHLVLNCLAPDALQLQSRWLGEDARVALRPVEAPHACLQDLLTWYWYGLCRPLPFFPQSAFAYANAQRQGKPDPLRVARDTWEGSEWSRGEVLDPYYQCAFRSSDPLDGAFEEVASAVVLPLFSHQEPQ
jgi:exodeoxyribonuclease V gamma subunit